LEKRHGIQCCRGNDEPKGRPFSSYPLQHPLNAR
jgi:hypothetical protein